MHSFDDIIGQKTVVDHLKKAIALRKPSHAYIFCGDEGSGKKLLADRFAAGLLCDGAPQKDQKFRIFGTGKNSNEADNNQNSSEDDDGRPCGQCSACMQTGSGNHPDIIYVTHEKKNITVGDIRTQLVKDIAVKPYSGQFKIYIIEDADKMNEEAQNALLKTLEEPPEYAVILLLARNTGAFLQTILSRCVMLRFVPLDNDTIKGYLIKRLEIPDYFAKLCAAFSNGSIGRAVKYASSEQFSVARERTLRIVKNIDQMTQADLAAEIVQLNPAKNDESSLSFDDYLDLFGIWFHDVLIFKATADANKVVFLNEISDIRSQASKMSYEQLSGIIEAIDRTRQRLNANVYFDVAVELLLIKLRGK
ncbi:MAG: DNA polymerase III subunit [Lachnospiraceae bacterium]|nr:DNA polymerase III subunit [Lachnospiraceae bacterium]